jgi:hypothetical protein
MTATVQRVGEGGAHYLYELRCACDTVIRTDGGPLPARSGEHERASIRPRSRDPRRCLKAGSWSPSSAQNCRSKQ